MAKRKVAANGKGSPGKAAGSVSGRLRIWRVARRWLLRLALAYAAVIFSLIVLFRFVNPPTTPYILSQTLSRDRIERRWTPLEGFSPVLARSVVAAEDANFCLHGAFDLAAIRAAAEAGMHRGGSTIDQQVVKNVFLWQGHSWPRKVLEALITPVAELVWPKRRIIELYLNLAETGKGAFGMTAAAARAFAVEPGRISEHQAALLAAILPDPEGRNAAHPTPELRRRAQEIVSGARTIHADGRAACFEH